jgi:hypothetical protein
LQCPSIILAVQHEWAISTIIATRTNEQPVQKDFLQD